MPVSDVMKVDPAAKLPGVAVHALLTVLTVLTVLTKITPKMPRTSDCFTAVFAHSGGTDWVKASEIAEKDNLWTVAVRC